MSTPSSSKRAQQKNATNADSEDGVAKRRKTLSMSLAPVVATPMDDVDVEENLPQLTDVAPTLDSEKSTLSTVLSTKKQETSSPSHETDAAKDADDTDNVSSTPKKGSSHANDFSPPTQVPKKMMTTPKTQMTAASKDSSPATSRLPKSSSFPSTSSGNPKTPSGSVNPAIPTSPMTDDSDDESQQGLRKSSRRRSTVASYQFGDDTDDEEMSDDDDESESEEESEEPESESSESESESFGRHQKQKKKETREMQEKREQREKMKAEKQKQKDLKAKKKQERDFERLLDKQDKEYRKEERKAEREKRNQIKLMKQAVREVRREAKIQEANGIHHFKQKEKAAKDLKNLHAAREEAMKASIKNLRAPESPEEDSRDDTDDEVEGTSRESQSPRSVHTDSIPYGSAYFDALNIAFRGSPKNFDAIRQFASRAYKLPSDCYVFLIRDPYYEAGFYRGHWTTGWLGSNGDRDQGLVLDPNEEKRILDERWKPEIQGKLQVWLENKEVMVGEVKAFTKKLNVPYLGGGNVQVETGRVNLKKRAELMTHFVHKFLLIIKDWKRRHEDVEHLRVIKYFFHIMEVLVVKVPLDGQDPIYQDVLPTDEVFRHKLVRNMLLWLPLHVADLTGPIHHQRAVFYDLARQLFAVVLDEWELVVGVRNEELGILNSMKIAALRLECSDALSTKPIVDRLPFCKAADIRGVTGKEKESKNPEKPKPKPKRRSLKKLDAASYCEAGETCEYPKKILKPRCNRPECLRALHSTSLLEELPHCRPVDHRGRSSRRSRSCFARFHEASSRIKGLSDDDKRKAALFAMWKENPLEARSIQNRVAVKPIQDPQEPFKFAESAVPDELISPLFLIKKSKK